MKHLFTQLGAALIMLLFAFNAHAQYPEPCMPGGNFETVDYPPEDGCSPAACYAVYRVTFDTLYGIACNAECIAGGTTCSPDRVSITSGPAQCTVDLSRCSVSYPYYCTLITSEKDICNGTLCSQTQGPPYCTNQQPTAMKENNRAKTILAALRAHARSRS